MPSESSPAANLAAHHDASRVRAYWATEQHIALLATKRNRLNQHLDDAIRQYIEAVRREWEAGNIGWADLLYAFTSCREYLEPAVLDFRELWRDSDLPHRAKIQQMVRNVPEPGHDFWMGPHPWADTDRVPQRGANVVYVLFTDDLQPCYVGSTEAFGQRMSEHRHDGKQWAYWVAYPCRDREHAYEIEERFLRQYLPVLNKRRGR